MGIFLSTKEGHFWVRNEKDSFMNLNPISWIFFLQRGHNFLDNIVPKRTVWGLTQVIRILANSLDRPIRLLIYLLLGNGEIWFYEVAFEFLSTGLRFSNYSRVPNKRTGCLFICLGHSLKSIWVMRLSFCQNDPPLKGFTQIFSKLCTKQINKIPVCLFWTLE